MNLLFKSSATGETSSVAYNEFKGRILKGEVLPQDQVNDRVLTNGHWWTVDNLRIFHRLSPIRCAKGSHLLVREKAEEEQHRLDEAARTEAAAQAALAREFFGIEWPGSGIIQSTLYRFLVACHEKPLRSDPCAQQFRFSWLRTFHKPVAIRIAEGQSGAILRVVRLSGAGGFDLGGIEHDETFPITAEQRNEFLDRLAKASFWDMPAVDETRGGVDGSDWILEGLRSGDYHLVDRWSPEQECELAAYVACCSYLLELSRLQIPEGEVY